MKKAMQLVVGRGGEEGRVEPNTSHDIKRK
jgi:hypothetical protein